MENLSRPETINDFKIFIKNEISSVLDEKKQTKADAEEDDNLLDGNDFTINN
jgi:hypothetical protein